MYDHMYCEKANLIDIAKGRKWCQMRDCGCLVPKHGEDPQEIYCDDCYRWLTVETVGRSPT